MAQTLGSEPIVEAIRLKRPYRAYAAATFTGLSLILAACWAIDWAMHGRPRPWFTSSAVILLGAAYLWASLSLVRLETLLARIANRGDDALGGGQDCPPDADSITRLSSHMDTSIALARDLDHRNAHRHGVTRLPTREPLIDAIARCPQGGVLGIVELCDFDRLSAFDIAMADEVLKDVATRLLRMVGTDRFLAHVDRARFAIWYSGSSPDMARKEFDAVCYALRDRIVLTEIDMLPQIRAASVIQESVVQDGAAFKPAALLARTIAALSDSRAPQMSVHGTQAMEKARNSFLLEQDLRQAVARNELELWFQPFVDASAGRVCGAEALLRWRHPRHGLIAPNQFIPIVEMAGLADEVGRWTLNAGCREAREWTRQGLGAVKVAINLSAHQLGGNSLDRIVERTLHRHDLPPGLLELELTETVAAVDSSAAKTLFEKLRALGVSISIDDFGAGYSSLSYLKKLKFDKLKIDREFITHVDRQADSQAICQSIIALGRGLGIAVLAEGIERREEYAWLRRHGCDLFQGFYFSHPLEADAFPAFARHREHLLSLTDLSPVALQRRLTTSAL